MKTAYEIRGFIHSINMAKAMTIFLVVTVSFYVSVAAHDYVPGEKQSQPILLKGGNLHTISNGLMENTDILFENGRIANIGTNLTLPDNTEIIDVTGKEVYPGIIAPATNIGLTEIGAVRATNDTREIGMINPNVKSRIAYNPDSEIIPSVRAHGITTALIVPGGSVIAGISSLINLDGWTVEDAAEKIDLGLHLNWPGVLSGGGRFGRRQDPGKIRERQIQARENIYQMFRDARAYYNARQTDADMKIDERWEAMMPVFSEGMPVFISANDYRQIEQAVSFSKEFGLKMILVGGGDAWMCTDLLKENDVPVITRSAEGRPMRADEAYDMAFTLPAKLAEGGVDFCIGQARGTGTRNLPFQAGRAAGNGLSKEEALRAITLSTAEILGVADDLGSLEVGKKATIVVSEGDIMDMVTQNVVLEFIEGRKVDLNNKHKELYEKYRQKSLN
ncbi:MAG: amidohydrolase family protein [candidate division Zixibacteria bacterium]